MTANEYISAVDTLEDYLESKYGVTVSMTYNKSGGAIMLNQLEVPEKLRGGGIGSKVMKELCRFADKHFLRIGVTPTGDYGGNVRRLHQFYRSFGFVPYRGNEFFQSFVRNPTVREFVSATLRECLR